MQNIYSNPYEHEVKETSILELEVVLTKSAFGHEYALMNLSENTSFLNQQQILVQLEEHKKNYFWARDLMEKMNPEKLKAIEDDIRFQKEMILSQAVTLH